MQMFKSLFVLPSLLLFLFFSPLTVYSLPCSSHSLSLAKGLSSFVANLSPRNKNIKWHSNNPSVASVDSNGIVYANSIGIAEISATNDLNSKTYKYEVHVTPPEPVRSVFTNCPFPSENESFSIFVLTPKNVKSVKIILEGPNYKHEVHKKTNSKSGDFYLWSEKISSLKPGNYSIKALSNIDGEWKECSNSYMRLNVFGYYSKSDLSTSKRNLSKEGACFIARQEGFCSHVYRDMAGILTIGYGKVIHPNRPFYNVQNRNEAYQNFLNDLNASSLLPKVNNMLTAHSIKFNQHQFDALVSFTYNLGQSWTRGSKLKELILNCGKGKPVDTGIVCSKNGLILRQAPSQNSRKLTALGNNTEVTILDTNIKEGFWCKVRTFGGATGYCFAKYIKIKSTPQESKNLNFVNKEKFANEFLYYHHIGNKCIKGLLLRRIRELEIFFEGAYNAAINLNKYLIPTCAKRII